MALGRLKQAGRRGQQKRGKNRETHHNQGDSIGKSENTLPLSTLHLIPLNHQIMGYLLDSEHMHENHGKIAPKRRTEKEEEKQHQGMPNTGNR